MWELVNCYLLSLYSKHRTAFFRERDFYEAMIASGKQHTWLPEYYGDGVWNGDYYIALELLGQPLQEFKARDLSDIKHCALGALRALQLMHDTGHLHNDVKLEVIAIYAADSQHVERSNLKLINNNPDRN